MIRPAKPADFSKVAPLIIQAMGELAGKLTHTQNQNEIDRIFEYLFQQKGNQYSYENTLVFDEAGEVLGALNAYDGGKLTELRKPFLTYIHSDTPGSNNPDTETQSGEFYLDSISVNPKAQGKGIGKELIKAGISWGRQLGHQTIGLLVEQNNEQALKLYEKMGFVIQNEKQFMGGWYHHMVFKVKENQK